MERNLKKCEEEQNLKSVLRGKIVSSSKTLHFFPFLVWLAMQATPSLSLTCPARDQLLSIPRLFGNQYLSWPLLTQPNASKFSLFSKNLQFANDAKLRFEYRIANTFFDLIGT